MSEHIRDIPDEVSNLEGTLRSVITVLPVISFLVGIVGYCFNLQSQINVLQVRQEAAIVQNSQSLQSLKEDVRDLADVLRQVAPRGAIPNNPVTNVK